MLYDVVSGVVNGVSLPFRDGDLATNVFSDTAGYFREVGTTKIDPIGVGLISKAVDRGAITVTATGESQLTGYINEYRDKIENETGSGSLWRVVEELNSKYYDGMYQKSIIIERKRTI